MKDERWSLSWKTSLIILGSIGLVGLIALVVIKLMGTWGVNVVSFASRLNVKELESFGSKILTKETLWLVIKIVVFFSVFVFVCHGPLKWAGFLVSIEDGKAVIIKSGKSIWKIKPNLYGHKMDKYGKIVKINYTWFTGPIIWFRKFFFGSLFPLGIPGIHKVETGTYKWDRLDPSTGDIIQQESRKGEIPLREFVPLIDFKKLDVVGGQINTKIGPLIKIVNPTKAATVPRDWFPFFVDMIRGHIRECFAPLSFFRVMINRENFGETDTNGKLIDTQAEDLSSYILSYFNSRPKTKKEDEKEIKELEIDEIKDEEKEKEKEKEAKMSLVEFTEYKYGIRILKFFVIDPDPTKESEKLLDSTSKPALAKVDADVTVINAEATANAFNKTRTEMEKPGGRRLRELQALEKSRLVTLGDGKGLNIFVDTSKQEKGGDASGNP